MSIYLHALGLSFTHPVTKEKLKFARSNARLLAMEFFKDIEKNILR